MSDIVERLRQYGRDEGGLMPDEAADEIERLRADEVMYESMGAEITRSHNEIERLRNENAMLTMGLRAIIDDMTGAELSKARAARAQIVGTAGNFPVARGPQIT